MSKRVRTLAMVLAAVVLLVIGLLVLLMLPEKDSGGDDSSSSATATTTMAAVIDKATDGKSETVASVTVALPEAEAFTVAADADGLKSVAAYASLPRNAAAIDELLRALTTIRPTALARESADDATLTACGFDKPAATVSVTYEDGTTFAFELGGVVPGEQTDVYFRQADSRRVYLIGSSFADTVTRPATAYIGQTLVSAPTADGSESGTAQLMTLTLSGAGYTQPVTLRYHESADDKRLSLVTGYVITQPYFRSSNEDITGSWKTGLNSLTASGVAAAFPTAEQLAAFGLDAPHTVASLTLAIYSEKNASGETLETPSVSHAVTYTVRLGKTDENGDYYAMLDGVNAVYTVKASAVPWAGKTYDDLVTGNLFMKYITEIAKLSLTVNGQETVIALKHTGDTSDSDNNLIATVGDRAYTAANTRALYRSLMSIERLSGADRAQPSGDPVLTVKLTPTAEGGDPVTVSLYAHSANRYLCRQADGDTYLVKASQVEDALRQIAAYLAGETVVG